MTDQLRTLAEAEAVKRVNRMEIVDGKEAVGFRNGFIAGRASVTREQVVAAMTEAMEGACTCHLDSFISHGVNAVLALLNGESNV